MFSAFKFCLVFKIPLLFSVFISALCSQFSVVTTGSFSAQYNVSFWKPSDPKVGTQYRDVFSSIDEFLFIHCNSSQFYVYSATFNSVLAYFCFVILL